LETVLIEEGATRPPMFWGLPRKLSALLLALGALLFVLISSTIWEAIALGSIGIVWFTVKPLVAMDYHGFDNFCVWARLDAPCLDRREWGGTRFASFPLREKPFVSKVRNV
jgi:type IV secretory pathway VirB3-like protein